MARLLVSSTVRIDIEIPDFSGGFIDPSAQTLDIYDPNGAKKKTYSQGDADYVRDSQGKYHCNYPVPSNGVKGLWLMDWNATVGALPEHRIGYFVVV